jgi:hypothetical protein
MTLTAIGAEAKRELSAIELDGVVGGAAPRGGYGQVYDVPPPPRVVNAPVLGGGGSQLPLPHLRQF